MDKASHTNLDPNFKMLVLVLDCQGRRTLTCQTLSAVMHNHDDLPALQGSCRCYSRRRYLRDFRLGIQVSTQVASVWCTSF